MVTDITMIKTKTLLDRVFCVATKVFVLVGMVFFLPNQQAYGPQVMFYQHATIFLAFLSLLTPPKRRIVSPWLALILLYMFLRIAFAIHDANARLQFANVFFFAVALKVIAERISLEFKTWGKAFFFFCLLNMGWMALQAWGRDPLFSSVAPQNMPQTDIVGFMGARYALGNLAALSFPFIWAWNPVATLVCLPLIFYSKACTCACALLASFLFVLYRRRPRLFAFLVPVLLAACAWYVFMYDMPTGQFGKRITIWLAGIQIWMKGNLWWGLGLGRWSSMMISTTQENGVPEVWSWMHNDYLQAGFELGVAGLTLITGYLISIFKRLSLADSRATILMSVWVSLVLVSMFHFPFHVGRFAVLCTLIIALTEAYFSELKPSEDEI